MNSPDSINTNVPGPPWRSPERKRASIAIFETTAPVSDGYHVDIGVGLARSSGRGIGRSDGVGRRSALWSGRPCRVGGKAGEHLWEVGLEVDLG